MTKSEEIKKQLKEKTEIVNRFVEIHIVGYFQEMPMRFLLPDKHRVKKDLKDYQTQLDNNEKKLLELRADAQITGSGANSTAIQNAVRETLSLSFRSCECYNLTGEISPGEPDSDPGYSGAARASCS